MNLLKRLLYWLSLEYQPPAEPRTCEDAPEHPTLTWPPQDGVPFTFGQLRQAYERSQHDNR